MVFIQHYFHLEQHCFEIKPCINRESKSLELTIKLYSCHDINMKFLVVVTPPSIYQIRRIYGDTIDKLYPCPEKTETLKFTL